MQTTDSPYTIEHAKRQAAITQWQGYCRRHLGPAYARTLDIVAPKLALMDATWTINLAPINNIRVLTAFGLVYLTARSNPRR